MPIRPDLQGLSQQPPLRERTREKIMSRSCILVLVKGWKACDCVASLNIFNRFRGWEKRVGRSLS